MADLAAARDRRDAILEAAERDANDVIAEAHTHRAPEPGRLVSRAVVPRPPDPCQVRDRLRVDWQRCRDQRQRQVRAYHDDVDRLTAELADVTAQELSRRMRERYQSEGEAQRKR